MGRDTDLKESENNVINITVIVVIGRRDMSDVGVAVHEYGRVSAYSLDGCCTVCGNGGNATKTNAASQPGRANGRREKACVFFCVRYDGRSAVCNVRGENVGGKRELG